MPALPFALDVEEDTMLAPAIPDFGNPTLDAASTVHDAALTLAADSQDVRSRDRYLSVAVNLADAMLGPPDRSRILAASPRVQERGGRTRTLVEMIEAEPVDDSARYRLAMLLMRALIWDPADPGSAREVIRRNSELIRYQRLLIARRLHELRQRKIAPVDH
jgi:hypothetical protein